MKYYALLFSLSLFAQNLDRLQSFPKHNINQESVSFSFPIENGEAIIQPKPFVAESRGYSISLNEKDLFQGVPIHISHPGPILVLSNKSDQGFVAEQLVLIGAEGDAFFAEDAFEMGEESELRSPSITQTLRIKPELGSGTFYLVGDQIPNEKVEFTLAVLEPQSLVRVSAQADSDRYSSGDQIRVQLDSNLDRFSVVNAQLRSSQGERIQRSFDKGVLSFSTKGLQGLVEIRIEAEGIYMGRTVRRDMKTLVHVAVPTARILKRSSGDRGESVWIEVGQAGRYELRGFWQEKSGDSMVPVQAEHQAKWLGPGVHIFQFAPMESGNSVSFGNLFLFDQTQMALLEHLP